MRTLLLCFVLLLCGGCVTEEDKLERKHEESSRYGLWRKVTFYPQNGTPIVWAGRYKVENNGGNIQFLHEGKVITIGGSFLVEEIDPLK